MTILALLYIALGFGALTALCIMILRIGTMLATCPDTGAAARAGAVTIATGFAAIGAGGVILIGALLPAMEDAPMVGFLLALGFASLCLGLGFTHAVATLRAVVFGRDTQADDLPPAPPEHPAAPIMPAV